MVLDRFSGTGHPEDWIYRAESYFTFLGFSEEYWLPLPSLYLDGEALEWFRWMFRNKQFFDWKHFKEKLVLRFRKQTYAKSPVVDAQLTSILALLHKIEDKCSFLSQPVIADDARFSVATSFSRAIASPLAEETSSLVDNIEGHPELFETSMDEPSGHVDNMFDERSTGVLPNAMADRSSIIAVNSTIQSPASLGSFTHLQVADMHDPNSSLTDGDKCAQVEDKVFDEISHSDEPALPCHCASDETLFIPLVGHDYLVPYMIEPVVFSESLFVESEKLSDATALTSRRKSDLETEQVGEAQVFPKSPHRNTDQSLSPFELVVMDPFASLVLSDKFPFGHVVSVSVNLDDGHMLETYYSCHTGACTYLYYASESSIGTIPFCYRVDNWFDTGQDFEVGLAELTQVSHEKSWLIPFCGCEYIQLYDEKFTMANEVSSDPKKFVPDEVFLIQSENPSWAAEFASIIKQPQLHNFHLAVLSRIGLNFQRTIVEVARFLRCLSGQPFVSLMPKAVEHENTKAEFVGSDFPFDPGINFLTTCLGFSQNCVVFEASGSLKLASNATLCKFLLKFCDKTILEESDKVMIDRGFYIDGLIVVVDHIHVIQEEPTIGRAVDVIAPATEATEVIPRLVRPGRETTNVPNASQKVVDVYDYKIGESVACVQLKQFLVVGNKVILSVSNPAIRMDKYIKQETLASGVVNNLINALNPIAIKAPRIIDFPIKEYPIPLSKTVGYTAQVDLSMELPIVGDVFYMEANSGQNDTFATEFSRDAAVYVPWLNTNLEDKVLFEGRSIVVNQADFVRAYGIDVVNGADSVGIIGPIKMLESFIWDPGPITNWLNRNCG